jgi:hypothetical protein
MIVATKEIGWVVLSSEGLFCKRCVSDAIIEEIDESSAGLISRRSRILPTRRRAKTGDTDTRPQTLHCNFRGRA